MAAFVKKIEFARIRGVTRQLLTAWQAKGLLVLSDDGRVNVEASNALLDGRPEIHKGGKCSAPSPESVRKAASARKPARTAETRAVAVVAPTPPDDDPDERWTTAEAIRRKESAVAKLKQLEFEQRAGRLLDATEVDSTWRGYLTDLRKRMLTIPSRCGARLSHLSRSEVAVIDKEVRDALQELSGESLE
jgi:phage terminase Nu1 subunit (DNA packaging protein)